MAIQRILFEPLNYRRRYVGWKPKHPIRFVAIILGLLLLIASPFVWRKYETWRRQQAVTAIQSAGGIVSRDLAGDIDRVHLASPRIGDAQLKDLADDLRRLNVRQLDLVGENISDEGLRRLRGQLRVTTLHIFRTKATEQGIADLGKSLPNTQIKRTNPDPIATQLVARDVHRHAVISLTFTPDGNHLLSGSGDGKLRVWDLKSNSPLATISSHANWLFSIALSPDGTRVATGGGDNLIHLYDLSTLLASRGERDLQPVRTLIGHSNDVHALSFLSDDALVSAGDDRTLRYWNTATGATTRIVPAHERPIPSLATSRLSDVIATASRDDTVRTWNKNTGDLLHTLPHEDDVNSISFNPAGTLLASASYDGRVRLWNTQSGTLRREIKGHQGRVFTVAFDPTGQRLISAGADGTVRLWTLDGTPLESSADQQLPAAIAFGGALTATSAADGTILLRNRETLAVHRRLLPDYERVAMKP